MRRSRFANTRDGIQAAFALVALLNACGSDAGPPNVPRPSAPASLGPIEWVGGQSIGEAPRYLGVDDGPRFSGLAMWNGGQCTAFYAVPPALDLSVDGPAYVFTNGHCALDQRLPNAVFVGAEASVRPHEVTFRMFADSKNAATNVRVKKVLYATMKGVDVAIAELNASRFTLRKQGIVPFVLVDEPANEGEPLGWAGHAGFEPAQFSACQLDRRVPMVLESPWHWFELESNRCLGVRTGASGSPMFSLSSGKVTGVLNTRVEPSAPIDCASSAPCEALPSELVRIEETNYAIPLSALTTCFDATGRFDLSLSDCSLDRGIQMLPPDILNDRLLISALGQPVNIDIPLESRGLTHYRTGWGPAATTDCRDPSHYGPVVAWNNAPTLRETFPGEPGFVLICLQAGDGPDPAATTWQDLRTPTVISFELEAP